MGPFLALFALALGAALTVLAGGAAIRRGLRPGWTAAAYRDAAMALGLAADGRGTGISGYVGERRVWIGEVVEDLAVRVEGRVAFDRPLGLGLLVERGGRRGRLLRRRASSIPSGDPALDRALTVAGDDEERIRAWLTPPVREALGALLARTTSLAVTDDEIAVGLASPPTTRGEIVALAEALLAAAEAFEASRHALTPPAALAAAVSRWGEVATALGLTFDARGPALLGTLGGRPIVVGAGRTDDGYAAYVQVRFHAHPEAGLMLRPQGLGPPDGQDLIVGDDAFDARFEIKGYDPDAVKRRLDPGVRAHLMSLADDGELRVDDRAMLVENVALDPENVRRVLERAVEAARALGW